MSDIDTTFEHFNHRLFAFYYYVEMAEEKSSLQGLCYNVLLGQITDLYCFKFPLDYKQQRETRSRPQCLRCFLLSLEAMRKRALETRLREINQRARYAQTRQGWENTRCVSSYSRACALRGLLVFHGRSVFRLLVSLSQRIRDQQQPKFVMVLVLVMRINILFRKNNAQKQNFCHDFGKKT